MIKNLTKLLGKTEASELLGLDLLVGVAAAGGGVTLGIVAPDRLLATTGVASQVLGVVIGAVIAGVAVQTAFLDQTFLRKLRLLGRPPTDYLRPLLFTIVVGIIGLIGIITLSAMKSTDTPAVLAITGGVTAFFIFWSLTSVLPALDSLLQFIQLRDAAVDVPDTVEVGEGGTRRRTANGSNP